MQKKKVIEVLDELQSNEELTRLVSAGLVSSSVIIWRNAYHRYKEELSTTKSKMQAMQNVSDEFNLSVRMVQYIRDRMEQF